MSFELEHWTNPRNTIANVYKDNDMSYTIHGIKSAMNFMKLLDVNLSQLSDKSILDYGCGTAKNLRPLTYIFNECVGYDPVKECIEAGNEENTYINKKVPGFDRKVELLDLAKLKLTYDLNTLVDKTFDYVIAIDVFQHLDSASSKIAIDNMLEKTKSGGYCLFNMTGSETFIPKEYKSRVVKKNAYIIIKK